MLLALSSSTYERKTQLNSAYVDAFTRNGAIPLVIPNYKFNLSELATKEELDNFNLASKEICDRVDGLILTGGSDISPLTYGETNQGSVSTSINRDKLEISLLKAFVLAKKPVFAICKGHQLVGSFFRFPNFCQDISKSSEYHNGNELEVGSRTEPIHNVTLRGSLLAFFRAMGYLSDKQTVVPSNSFHHQAFVFGYDKEGRPETYNKNSEIEKIIAEELTVLSDRKGQKYENPLEVISHTHCVIEGFQHRSLPICSIQGHPEEYSKNSMFIEYFFNTYFNKEK